MTDEKRRDEAHTVSEEDLRSFYRAYYRDSAERALIEYANKIIPAALASRDAEIERLRSEYNSTISYNIDERAKPASLLKEKDEEIERLRTAERQLSDAYIRLRALIPGAFDTPHGPSPEEVWAHTEAKLAELARLRAQPQLRCKRTGNICGTDTWAAGHPCQCENCQRYLATVLRAQPVAAHPWYGPCDALGPDGQCAECLKVRAKPADDVERVRKIVEGYMLDIGGPRLDEATSYEVDLIDNMVAAVTATRHDATRQALEEAARLCGAHATEIRDRTRSGLLTTHAAARAGAWLDAEQAIRALADKPATTSPDIISLVRAYRRAVESSPVSNVLELQEWRDLCAAMNAIDAAEGAR